MANQRKHAYLCIPEQAAAFPTGLAFPGGLDAFICPDGRCLFPGPQVGAIAAGHPPGAAAVWNPAGRKLFLVDFLFQSVALLFFFHLARFLVVFDFGSRCTVLPYLPGGWAPDASIFAVGRICRISELGNLSAQLTAMRGHSPSLPKYPLFFQPVRAARIRPAGIDASSGSCVPGEGAAQNKRTSSRMSVCLLQCGSYALSNLVSPLNYSQAERL